MALLLHSSDYLVHPHPPQLRLSHRHHLLHDREEVNTARTVGTTSNDIIYLIRSPDMQRDQYTHHGNLIHHAQMSRQGEVRLTCLLGHGAQSTELKVTSIAVIAEWKAWEAGFGETAPQSGAEIAIIFIWCSIVLL